MNLKFQIHRISCFPYRHFERSEKSSLHSALSCSFRKRFPLFRAFLFPSQKHSRFLLSHIRRYTGVQERSLDFARDDDTGIALSKHIRCTLREITPAPHTVISSKVEKYSSHSTFSCFLRKRVLLFGSLTYGYIPVCKKDPSAPLGMTIREKCFLSTAFTGYAG